MEIRCRKPALSIHGTVDLEELLDSQRFCDGTDDIRLVSHHVCPGKSDDPFALEECGVVPSPVAVEALTRSVPLSTVHLDDQVVSL
jgi:hypothetical protein